MDQGGRCAEGGELSSCESGAQGAERGRGLGRREYRGQRCGPTRLPRASAPRAAQREYELYLVRVQEVYQIKYFYSNLTK